MQFIDLQFQQERIRDQIDANIKNVLDHGKYIMGPEVFVLEERLADYVGCKHCISTASGTDALLIALMALGVGRGDEVITTPFTFIATGEVIMLLGAKPVFVDIDFRTYNLDPQLVEDAITPRTKAIMPVSLYGQCADLDAINQIASRHNLSVIEDACQSFGATYKGKKSCNLSDIGCTSFFPSKPLGAYGDGGACFTNDDALAKSMREIRVHGQNKRYHHQRIGFNGRLDTIQAAVLLAKLKIFPDEISKRINVANRYSYALKDFVKVPFVEEGNSSVYAQYTIEVENRDEVQLRFKDAGIPTSVHYPIPLNMQSVFKGKLRGKCKVFNAISASKKVLSLPMHPYLNLHDQDLVIELLR